MLNLMLGQRRRRWYNVMPILCQRLLFAGEARSTDHCTLRKSTKQNDNMIVGVGPILKYFQLTGQSHEK